MGRYFATQTSKRVAQVAAIATAIALLFPFLFSADQGYGGLVAIVICWIFIAPISALTALIFAASASVSYVRDHVHPRRSRAKVVWAWGVALAIALAVGGIYIARVPPAPVMLTLVIASILSLAVGLCTVAFAFLSRAHVDPAAPGRPRYLRVALACVGTVAVLTAAGIVIPHSIRVSEYRQDVQTIRHFENLLASKSAAREFALATACLSEPLAKEKLNRVDTLVASSLEPVLPAKEVEALAAASRNIRATLRAFDPDSCARAAKDFSERFTQKGGDLDSIDWLTIWKLHDVEAMAAIDTPVPWAEVSYFRVTRAVADGASLRAEQIRDEYFVFREDENLGIETRSIIWSVLDLPEMEVAATAPAASAQVIGAAGAGGTPAAAALRSLATSASEADGYAALGRLEQYVSAANTMLKR